MAVDVTDRLFRYANEQGNGADPATKEALRYRTALQQGCRMLKEVKVGREKIFINPKLMKELTTRNIVDAEVQRPEEQMSFFQ